MSERPENTEIKQDRRKILPQLFVKGQSGNPAGRPRGSVSIKDAIRQRLRKNPEEFEELVGYYLKDRKMRELLWKMLEGMPQGSAPETNLSIAIPIFGGKSVSTNDSNAQDIPALKED